MTENNSTIEIVARLRKLKEDTKKIHKQEGCGCFDCDGCIIAQGIEIAIMEVVNYGKEQ